MWSTNSNTFWYLPELCCLGCAGMQKRRQHECTIDHFSLMPTHSQAHIQHTCCWCNSDIVRRFLHNSSFVVSICSKANYSRFVLLLKSTYKAHSLREPWTVQQIFLLSYQVLLYDIGCELCITPHTKRLTTVINNLELLARKSENSL